MIEQGETEEEYRAFLKNNRIELSPEESEMVNSAGIWDLLRDIGKKISDGVSDLFD